MSSALGPIGILGRGRVELNASWVNGSGNWTSGEPWRWEGVAFALIPVPIAAAFGNLLVMFAVASRSELQTSTGTLIFSMAVSDVVLGIFVMPFSIVKMARGDDWPFGLLCCDLWHSLDIFASTASIWNLGAIAIDRRLAISNPLGYREVVSKNRVFSAIGVIWTVAGVLAFGPIPYWREMSPELYADARACEPTNDAVYVLAASLLGFYIPLAVILIMYWRVFKVASQHAASLITGSRRLSMGSSLFMRVHRGSQPQSNLGKVSVNTNANRRRAGREAVILQMRKKEPKKSDVVYRTKDTTEVSEETQRLPLPGLNRHNSNKSSSASELTHCGDQAQLLPAKAAFSRSSQNIRFPLGGMWKVGGLSERLLSAHNSAQSDSPARHRVKRWAQSYLHLSEREHLLSLYVNTESISAQGNLSSRCEILPKLESDEEDSSNTDEPTSHSDLYLHLRSIDSVESLDGEARGDVLVDPPTPPSPALPSPTLTKGDSMDVIPTPAEHPSLQQSVSDCPSFEIVPPDDDSPVEEAMLPQSPKSFQESASPLSSPERESSSGGGQFARLLTPEFRREEQKTQSSSFLNADAAAPLAHSPSFREKISKRLSVTSILRRRSGASPKPAMAMPMPPRKHSHIVRGFKKIWKEKRAAKTVGVVVGCFLVCWVPFFTVNIFVTVCAACLTNAQAAFTVATWFGYFNSALNPLIYAYFNKQFKRAFLQVLFCRGRKKRYGTIRMLVKQSVPMTQLLVDTPNDAPDDEEEEPTN